MASGSPSSSKPVTSFGPPGSKPVTSFGPAGSKVGVREAGANITREFCHQYPDTDKHSILPNIFGGNITELLDARLNLTRKEERQVEGRVINQAGEGHENVVFNMFVSLTRQPDIRPPLLVMRTFEMDTKNSLQLKRQALMSQLPTLDFGSTNTAAENDFVILVKDCGVVFVEVKGSNQDHMVRSADKQLTNVDSIVQCVSKALTGDQEKTIPTVKVLIVPDCTEPSPKDKSSQGSYHVYKNACENFVERWMEVVEELHQQKSSNPFTPDEFKELSHVLVGVWSAKVVSSLDQGIRKHELKQDESDLSLVEQLKKVDMVVNTGNVRDESQFKLTKDKTNPLTTIVRTGETGIFRSCNDIKLCYLNPPQNEVFTRYKHAIVHSPAGCGKSLLVLFKTLELVNTMELNKRILIVAPVPHNVRIFNCLKSNNVSVEKISQFPPPPSQCTVFVMDTNKFFKVDRDTLMGYDLMYHHLLIDDLQHLDLHGGKIVKFYDVGDFIEKTYATSVQQENSTYCWVMIDITQCSMLHSGSTSNFLFVDRVDENKRRKYSIPVVELSHVMRNTNDIIKFTNQQRENYVSNRKKYTGGAPFPSSQVGHKVMSRVPVVHKLQYNTLLPGRNETDTKKQFIISRLREELQLVTKPPYSFPLSNVAIIWYDKDDVINHYRDDVNDFLKEEFGTTAQTIEEQLRTNNDNDIIMDVSEHIMSFESPVIVYVRTFGGAILGTFDAHFFYKICSRARVLVTVVDVSGSDPISFNNIDTVLWKAHSNNEEHFTSFYIKYICTCERKWKQCKC